MPRSPSRIVRARYRATHVLHGRAETQELPMQESLHRVRKRDGWSASSFEAAMRQYRTVGGVFTSAIACFILAQSDGAALPKVKNGLGCVSRQAASCIREVAFSPIVAWATCLS